MYVFIWFCVSMCASFVFGLNVCLSCIEFSVFQSLPSSLSSFVFLACSKASLIADSLKKLAFSRESRKLLVKQTVVVWMVEMHIEKCSNALIATFFFLSFWYKAAFILKYKFYELSIFLREAK